ncbi:MAG: DUF4476 domain-containing protein, partial [Chitinophagaceae bacterium]
ERKTAGMYEATYLELYTLNTDTIRIFIPEEGSHTSIVTITEKENPTDSTLESKQILQEENTVTVSSADSTAIKKNNLQIINSDCKNFATEYDVDKFRVKLLNDKTIVEKMVSARKFYKSKCYSVNQVKALSELFPSDETKYQFFEISYPHIAETSNFYSLEEMIQGELYKNRFRELIKK